MYKVSIKECFAEGWELFKKYPGPSILGLLVFMVIQIQGAGGALPFVSFFYSMLISPIISIGLIILFLNIRDEKNPEVGNLFEGFKRFGRFLGVYYLMVVIVLAAMIPGVIVLIIGVVKNSQPLMIAGGVIALIVLLPVVFALSFVNYLAVDTELPVVECFKMSVELVKPRIGTVVLFVLAAIGINILGILCLIVGLFVSGSVTNIAWASLYRRIYQKEIVQGTPVEDSAVQA